MDPYFLTFERNTQSAEGSSLSADTCNEKQWIAFLSELEALELVSRDTKARFVAEYQGPRSFKGFQNQLLRWLEPSGKESTMEEVFASLDTNMTLLERLDDSSEQNPTRIREPPDFLCALHQQYESILHELDAFQIVGNQLLSDRVLHRQLCLKSSDHDDGEPSSISACPWRYQHENLIFLQRHERRHRPLAIKRQDRGTRESVVTRDTLASTFSPQLAGYPELQWYLASATLAANESDDNESDDEDDKADQKARSETEVVVVMSYRRRQAPSDTVTAVESLIAAHQELLLSPYFQQYLGCHEAAERDDPNEERTEQLYCFEFAPTLTLEQLLRTHGGFHEKSKAFRFFAREILLAIVDLQEQSTHTLYASLTPSNVLISYSGRRVLLGRLEFGESIDFFKTDITIVRCRRENERLADLALLLFVLRYGLTLPLNLSAFRSQYLACHDPQFVFEFALARTSQPCSIHVGVGSTFTLLLQEDDQAEWELVSVERLGLVAEDMASANFTFYASEEGENHLCFVLRTNDACLTVIPQIQVSVHVHALSITRNNGQLATLIQYCAAATLLSSDTSLSDGTLVKRPRTVQGLTLRHLLENHDLFQPRQANIDDQQLEQELHECLDQLIA